MSFLTQKLIWSKTKLPPDEKSHGLGTQPESCQKKCSISDDFRSPVIQKMFQAKSATSTVARAYKQTAQFLYLGGIIHEDADLMVELKRRVRLMRAC